MKPISDIVTIDGYVQQFSNDLAEKVRQQSEPLHNPEKDPRHPLLQKMKTKLFDKQQDLVSGCVKALDESGLAILACQMGTGKAQPNHCQVLTRTGWRQIGSIRVGEYVCTPDGKTARVTGVYPQGVKEVKRVTFTDGSSTLCCDEHLWEVTTPDRKFRGAKPMVKSLGELVKMGLKTKQGNLKYYIPITKPVYTLGGSRPLIEPYLLGYLIGNGCLASRVTVCIPDKETVERLSEFIDRSNAMFPSSYRKLVLKWKGKYDYRITHNTPGAPNALQDELEHYGLMGCHSDKKFIPHGALFSTPVTREALLQGLLDSDGYVEDGANSIEYTTSSSQLCRDVIALVQSLGGVATFTTKVPTFTHKGIKKTGMLCYRITLCLPPWVTPFKLTRKAKRYKPRTKYQPTRGMAGVTPAGSFECTCIALDSKEQLYITDDYIVTHNTPQGIATVNCHANGKPYRCLVICPPHLVTKWVSEVHKFLGGVRATIIENWQQFLQLRYEPDPVGPTWYIMAMTTAKLGYDRRAAVIPRTVIRETELGKEKVRAFTCPRCAYPVFNRKKEPATKDEIERLWLKCKGAWCSTCGVSNHHDSKDCPICDGKVRECGEALWQAGNRKVAPVQYVKAKGVEWFDYFIRDEAHQSKGCDSMDGFAASVFSDHSKYTLLLTGTLLAGKSEDIRPLLFRLKPRDFLNLGFGWKDEIPFAEQYGRLETVIKSSTGGETKRRTGRGSSKSTARNVKPGIMPQLFPDFVANYTVFMSLTELAINLPDYHEETISVPLCPIMDEEYKKMKKVIMETFKKLYKNNRKLAVKLLGPMLEAFLTWPDVPYGRKPVGLTDDMDKYHLVYQPPDLDPQAIYPKEHELMRLLKKEKAAGRKCWVFAVRDDTRDRLQTLLESHGFKVAALKATVKPSTRIDWIARNGATCDVGLSHPELVETGLELFGPGFNFPTLIWYSTGFKLNTLRQASRRSWRIGQPLDCKTIYLYYGDTAQSQAVAVMASKLVAAEALEGKFSEGGLADESVDEDVALSIAKNMADNITVKVQSRYKPVQAGSSTSDRVAMMLKRAGSFRDLVKSFQGSKA